MTIMPLSFPVIDSGVAVGGPPSSWWYVINESVKWQDGIFFTLCAVYAVVSAVALIQFVRIELRVPEYGWTTQKVFHLMNFIVNGVCAFVFGFHKQVFLLHPKALPLVVLDLPVLLFFSTYTILVLFWAEIYHQARGLPTHKLRNFYISINGAVYFTQVCIWVYLWINDGSFAQIIRKIFIAVGIGVIFPYFYAMVEDIGVLSFLMLFISLIYPAVSFTAALGFLLSGGSLYLMLKRFPVESKGRTKKLHEVGSVTAICFTCFLIRCFVVVLSVFDRDASLYVLDHPVLNSIYYVLVEILPSTLVLYILRQLPSKKISTQ